MSTEARELELCGKVEMRIALAGDDKLESILKPYLAPLLLKLGSEHATVRNKVMSVCQHVKVRLSGNQNIVLPVAALLKQYKENPDSAMIRHFDLMFIQQSVGKLSSSEQMDLLPTLLHGLSKDAGKPTCATMFNLFLRLLPRLRIPPRGSKEDTELRQTLGLDTHPEDAAFVASWFAKLMLLAVIRQYVTGMTCPGLTVAEYQFLTLNGKAEAWDPTADEGLNLTQTKICVLAFLTSGAFTDEERFLAALFASGDSNSRISGSGDDLLKRSTMSTENSDMIKNLLETYFTLKPALQTKLLILLTKSAVSTTFPEKVVRIVQEALQPDDNTNMPAKGLETAKFRSALFNYMNWVSRIGSKKDLAFIAPQLVGFLQSYIEDQGWPVPHDKSSDAATLRALAYETLGSLAKSTPSTVLEKELSLVKWLFRSLAEDASSDSIVVSIEGALSSLLITFAPPLEQELRDELRLLLLKYMVQANASETDAEKGIVRSARFATVRWANRCLEYSDIVGRWIDILALGGRSDERSDVVEEGKKGLDPYWYKILNASGASASITLPKWKEMIEVFFTSKSMLENASIANSMKTGMDVDSVSVFGNFAGTKISAFPYAVNYCRRMLFMTALEKSENPLTIDADWERQLDVLFRSDKQAREIIKDYVRSVDAEALLTYLTSAFEGMLRKDGNGLADCAKCFVDVASVTPSKVISKLADRAFELLPSVRSNNVETRFLAAQAFGILASHPINSKSVVVEQIKSLSTDVAQWETAVGAEANKIHGCILALGFVTSRASYYGRADVLEDESIEQVISTILEIFIGSKNASTKEAVLSAIGNMGASQVITLAQLEKSPKKAAGIITLLTEDAKKGNEKAITALGRLSIIFDDGTDSPLSSVLQSLYGLFELKQAEIHFSVGEALSCLSACWESDVLPLAVDVEGSYVGRLKRHETLEAVIQKLLEDCKTPKPSLKKASGIWLFSLISNSGHLPEFQARLRHCQGAFMGLLSARDDLVQETASRGLSLVYERGDKELREKLVADLVQSFTGSSSSTRLKVDDDTELFEPGALPTGGGDSVTSYKDIVNLANEVGDQSLVYKFMSLAANAATWSTRAAFGRFGLSNILSESEVDPKLYPKLYRYRFDPNPNVQRSMNDIWDALVKDSSATINDNFEAILADLLKSILGKEWRTREACCAAISDLIQGREFEKYEAHLQDIWGAAFKVLDDIKGSVRKAALSLSMALANILVRQLEAGTSSKYAQAMLKQVLPFLLSSQGIESAAKDVQVFSAITILKLIKHGGKPLLPFIPELVTQLLDLLSSVGEMEGIDYLYLRAGGSDAEGLTKEKIDNYRSSAVAQSPLMEGIDRCLDLLDEPTMKELVPRLENGIKTYIAVPSKIGAAGVLVSLATRRSFVFKPYADVFLKLMEKAVLDRNAAVSVSYARAAGYLSRGASDEAILRLAQYSQSLYFKAEDETKRQVSAELVYAVAKFATDRFNSVAAEFLPFVFFAKHDFDTHVKEQFEKTWSENVGGSRAVVLYSPEINALSTSYLDSPKWTIKHTAALTIADVVESSGAEISRPNAAAIWPALEKALALKTFEGKEKVLVAFVKFTKAGSSLWNAEPAIATQMKKIAIREAKRQNDVYRPHAFTSLGEFSEARTDIDMFEDVYNIVAPILEDYSGDDKMDTSDDAKGSEKSQESTTVTAGVSAIFRAVNIKFLDPSPLTHLPKVFDLMTKIIASTKVSVATKLTFYQRAKVLFEGLSKRTHTQGSSKYKLASNFFEQLEVASGAGNETLRLKRAEAAEMIVKSLATGVFGLFTEGRRECKASMMALFLEGRKNERSPGVQTVLDRGMKALESYE